MAGENQKSSVHSELEKLEKQIVFNKKVAWILVGVGAIAAIFGLGMLCSDNEHSSFLSKLSYLGSYFQGAVGSVWSLAGLMFIYVAFLGQKQQLLLQREAMELQKAQFDQEQAGKKMSSVEQSNELDRQREQFRLQQKSIKLQNFESGFFQLLNMQNQIVAGMRDSSGNGPVDGRDCFVRWYKYYFASNFSDYLIRRTHKNLTHNPQDCELVVGYYAQFYESLQGDLGHYFRSLYHIIKFVKTSDVVVTYEDKRRYTSLVRAQLSAFELALLFYNGISPLGNEKFKPWIEEFGLLEHLDKKLLLHPSHENFYDPKAYK